MAAREGTGMQPLSAEIITERRIGNERSAVRRRLRLGVSASASGDVAMALILNLSETGLLIETLVELAVGETLRIEFPDAIAATARVIWTEGYLAGCEFVEPVSTGAVSAALLMSSITGADASRDDAPSIPSPRQNADPQDYDESAIQTAIFIVTSLLSVAAVLIFLAAVLPL